MGSGEVAAASTESNQLFPLSSADKMFTLAKGRGKPLLSCGNQSNLCEALGVKGLRISAGNVLERLHYSFSFSVLQFLCVHNLA